LEKQPQRRNLITKLLCSNRKAKHIELRAASETLLAEPYAGAYRRVFFPDLPIVAAIYEKQDTTSTRADWRAFFEKLETPPKGGFYLSLHERKLSRSELMEFVGPDYDPPAHRASWLVLEWQTLKIKWNQYTVVDAQFPPAVIDLLKGHVTLEHFVAVRDWMSESPAFLRNWDYMRLAYIPHSWSSVHASDLAIKASWTAVLNDTAWVHTTAGDGPFRPCDVLPNSDPVRQDAPVADIHDELIEVLHDCGVQFGVAIPNAPAIERLRIQGPIASDEELLDLLKKAVSEANDARKRECLAKVLSERPLFSIPADRATPDRVTRISHSRLIWSDRTRSPLGNWLLPVDDYPEGTLSRQIIELLDSFLPIPRTATFTQVLEFLSWVWKTGPDANLVRHILPRAYGYAKKDLEANSSLLDWWNECVGGASVFVLGKRQWVPVAGGDMLFLDDLNESGLSDLVPTLEFATPGHFGETLADQVSTAKLLGVSLLSSRFRIELEPRGAQPIPEHWQKGFSAIQNWLRAQVTKTDDDDPEPSISPMKFLKLSRWDNLQTVLYDNGGQVQTSHVRAAPWVTGNIAVAGTPDDFGEELCKILFNQWRLGLRRDLVELIPKVAIQLTKIDDQAVVERWL